MNNSYIKEEKMPKAHSDWWVWTAILFGCLFATCNQAIAQAPKSYWTFERKGTLANTFADSTGFYNLDFAQFTGSNYTWETTGASGRSVTLTDLSSYIVASPNTAQITGSFTYMMCVKPGKKYRGGFMVQALNNNVAIGLEVNDYSTSPNGLFAIRFYTNTTGTSDNFYINLDGIGRKSWGWFVDDEWHHLAFVYNATTGEKQVWVDGQLPAGFSKTVASGNPITSGDNTNRWNAGVGYEAYKGGIDEYAYWTSALSPQMIYQQYLNVQSGLHYQYSTSITTVPAPSAVTAAADSNDFAITGMSLLNQLKLSPVPRFKPGNTLLEIVNWIDMWYAAGRFQPGVSDAQAAVTDTLLQSELVNYWHYMIYITNQVSVIGNIERLFANNNPSKKLGYITKRAQLVPATLLTSQTLTNDKYLQNGSGQFLNADGSVVGGTQLKLWRPSAATSTYNQDGNTQKASLTSLRSMLTRPIDLINENGEVISLYSQGALSQDPTCVSGASALGLDLITYQARMFANEEVQSYRDRFMIDFTPVTYYSMYQQDGYPQYRQKWSEARVINTKRNNQYYSTPDFYPRYPAAWRTLNGAFNGLQYMLTGRTYEITLGDTLFSPFLGAGYGEGSEATWIQSVQWGNLTKALTVMGAEFFYSGFFNEKSSYQPPAPPPCKPETYGYQFMMPSYSQAILSRAEDVLRKGVLMNGDVPAYYAVPNGAPGYNFYCGDGRVFINARKKGSKYFITAGINQQTNTKGQVEDSKNVTFDLDGNATTITARRQGAAYILDKTVAPTVFYQLDGWHEAKHPTRWSKDFNIEAELYDNTNKTFALKSDGIIGNDYTNVTTYITYADTATVFDTIKYNFTPRTDSTYYVWVRVKSRTGASTGFTVTLNGANAKTVSGITETGWFYWRYASAVKMKYVHVDSITNVLGIQASNKYFDFDRLVLTPDSTLLLPEDTVVTPCGTVTAVITPSGPTTFCSGNSVTLTATANAGYVWSTGATTQSIVVTTSGTYTVTVSDPSGCTGTSSGTVVTVNPTPTTPIITANGPITFCSGGSVQLTSSAPIGNTWSTGAVTQSITASASGIYTVTVTSGGCSKTSAPVTVTVNSSPATPVVTPSGATTFCNGGSVTLTAPVSTGYIWSNGSVTRSIVVSSAGSYVVTVTNAGGCTAASVATVVTVNAAPGVPSITPGGATSFCQGGSVTLTSAAATGYLWSTGATTQAINVTASGSYTVTVSNAGGCTAASLPTTVTVNPVPVATITALGNTNICNGQSVVLQASIGNSFLWSNGATTRSITVTTAATYSVTVTASGCTSSPSSGVAVSVQSIATPTITAGGDTTFCNGDSVLLSSSAAPAYSWSTGATTQTIYVKASGNYAVTITQSGCSATSTGKTITVKALPVPTIAYAGSTDPCLGETVVLTSNYTTGNKWSTGAVTQGINVTATNTYTDTVTLNGCKATATRVVTFRDCSGSCGPPTGVVVPKWLIGSSFAYLDFSSVTGATNYIFALKNTATGLETTTSTGRGSSYFMKNLSRRTRYEVKVKAVCGGTVGAYSGVVSFVTD